MARISNDQRELRTLIASLAARLDHGAGRWSNAMDPRVLRRFQLAATGALEVLDGARVPAAALDRARSTGAELMVAVRLLESGCTVEHEVATPTGRRVDFRARRDGATLCVHVKRAPQPTLRDAVVSIPSAWRVLEEAPRGIVIALSLQRPLRAAALSRALDEALAFTAQASVGDELVIDGRDGRPTARLRAIGPSGSRRTELVADLSQSFDDHVPRFQATLRKAFAQFMPRSENIIVVCGSAGGYEAFVTALLGSQIERWDRRPRVGELTAYGRGGDGFWAGTMRNQSRLALYWRLAADAEPLLFLREPLLRAGGSRGVQLARSIFT